MPGNSVNTNYTFSQANMYTSPVQDGPNSGNLSGDLEDSPLFDNELEDGHYEWDESTENLFGDLPGTDVVDGELHEKRKASSDNNDTTEESANKKREGEEKTAKKPGRKPLTAEPTTVSL